MKKLNVVELLTKIIPQPFRDSHYVLLDKNSSDNSTYLNINVDDFFGHILYEELKLHEFIEYPQIPARKFGRHTIKCDKDIEKLKNSLIEIESDNDKLQQFVTSLTDKFITRLNSPRSRGCKSRLNDLKGLVEFHKLENSDFGKAVYELRLESDKKQFSTLVEAIAFDDKVGELDGYYATNVGNSGPASIYTRKKNDNIPPFKFKETLAPPDIAAPKNN